MSKIQPVVTRQKNTIRKERAYDVLSIQRENGNGTTTYSEKATSPNKQKEKKKERNTCGYRGACIWKDDSTKGRGFDESIKKTKTKQHNTKVTPEKDVMASANQTPGGYKFAPLVASQQGRANQHEPAYFGLSSPWFVPSRSGMPLHVVAQPWLSLQRSISP